MMAKEKKITKKEKESYVQALKDVQKLLDDFNEHYVCILMKEFEYKFTGLKKEKAKAWKMKIKI
ncbi:hypothetical protein M0R04_09060 [Candidatus Dojkabacteria bacterium]|nr:hypothetical protein [Candidatus Dojkabacteria bacterium]